MAIIDYTTGPARIELDKDPTEIDRMLANQTLVVDPRRSRPSYFDGRFLAARDLTREQTYALARQGDLGNARRGGVIRGLQVARSGDLLRIAPGAGMTPNGELVTLPHVLSVPISQVPEDERLDISFGVADLGQPPASQRAGLYILGVRSAEYATRPMTRFPTTPRGAPGIEDGDIMEVAALALHPFRFEHGDDPDHLRSAVARAIFFERGGGVPPDVLALAMVYLEGGSIRWLDPYLLRRELAADNNGEVGLSATPRSLREAQLLQHDQQLGELLGQLRITGGLRFPANRYFRCLPPIGRMPAAAIDPANLSQVYFPPQMTVALSVVVDEELPALLESSLDLPAIDLEGDDDDFDHTYIQVLIPMPAAQIARLQLQRVVAPRLALLPPALGRRLPIDALRDFIAIRNPAPAEQTDRPEPAPLLAAWRQALASAGAQLLWYTRVPAFAAAPIALFDQVPDGGKAQRDTKIEADAKLDRDAKAQRDTKADADSKTERDAKNTTDTKRQTDAKTDADAKTERDGKTDRDKTQADNAAKVERDAKNDRDVKNERDTKNDTDTKNQRDAKNDTDAKNQRDTKNNTDAKNEQDAKNARDAKSARDTKNEKDAKIERDAKNEKDAKNERDAKAQKDNKSEKDTRDAKNTRDAKIERDNDKIDRDGTKPERDDPKTRRENKLERDTNKVDRDRLAPPRIIDLNSVADLPIPSDIARAEGPPIEVTPVHGPVRTFIEPRERPDLDSHVLGRKPGEA